MNRTLRSTCLLFALVASLGASAQSAAPGSASSPKSRAQVKAETSVAVKQGEGGLLEAPAVQAPKPKKRRKAAAVNAAASG